MPIAPVRLSGIVRPDDIPAHEVPPQFWTDGNNVSFRDIYAERVSGWRAAYDANSVIETPLFLQNTVQKGVNYWMYGSAGKVSVTDAAGTHTDLTPASGAPSGTTPTSWTGCELNGFPVVNWAGTAGPHSWDRVVSNNVSPLANWPAGRSCGVIRSHKFYLIALNMSGDIEEPSTVMWSDSAAPGNLPTTWVPAAGSDAGSFSVGETGTGIVDGLTLRDQFMIYKTHSTYIMQFVAGTLVFGQRTFLQNVGALANNCVAEWNGNHVVLTDGDFIIHDGNQVRSLIDKRLRRSVFANIDQTNYQNSFVVHNRNQNEVWMCYPENGATYPTRAVVWDTATGSISQTELNDAGGSVSTRETLLGGSGTPHIAHGNVTTSGTSNTWDSATGSWDSQTGAWNDTAVRAANDGLVAIDVDGDTLAFFDVGDSFKTGTLNASILRESLDFGDASVVKLVTEVWPRIVGKAGDVVNIRVGSQFEPTDLITWSPFVPFTIGSQQKVDTFASGRYLSFEFTSSNGARWKLTGFDVNLEQGGRY